MTDHQHDQQQTDGPEITTIDCPGCGGHYELTDTTLNWAAGLAEYAHVIGAEAGMAATSAPVLQWAQDIGRADEDGLWDLIVALDRKTIAAFLVDEDETAWRAVGAVLGFRPPFDVVQPDVPAGG